MSFSHFFGGYINHHDLLIGFDGLQILLCINQSLSKKKKTCFCSPKDASIRCNFHGCTHFGFLLNGLHKTGKQQPTSPGKKHQVETD